MAIGLFGAGEPLRTLTGVLFQVHPLDPITYLAIVVILFTTVFAACWFPALRAANIGSADAIRCE